MRGSRLAPSIVASAVIALASLADGACAQSYRPESFERPDAAPALNLSLSSAIVQQMNSEIDDDRQSLDLFARGKRGLDRFGGGHASEKPQGWKFYGRVYLLNFQNKLGETPLMQTEVTWRRTGPSLTGRIYIGVTRQF